METLDAIRARRSIAKLVEPGPSEAEIGTILAAAASAPDHGQLRPWRFVVLAGEDKDEFGHFLAAATEAEAADRGEVADPRKVDKDRTKMDRAPVVIAMACVPQPSDKIPVPEQFHAVAAATQNATLAATDLGYGSMWRTGPNATNPHTVAALGLPDEATVLGFLYLGTVTEATAKPPRQPSLDGIVSHWRAPG